jgi:hypothetical protein
MDDMSSQPDDTNRLRTLLKEAGYTSYRMDGGRRALFFSGRTRDWNIIVHTCNGWFNAYTVVCAIPEETGIRSRTLETAMRLNTGMSATKFVASDALVLEIDYRLEHLDISTLQSLIGLLHCNAEEYYPKIYRTVSGDDVLEALQPTALADAA